MRTNRKLPPEEIERLLTLYIQTHRADYRDRIVEAHLYIAEIIARKFSGRGVDYDDLFQVAALALTKAIERFDPERGVKFASFVTPGMVMKRVQPRAQGRAFRITKRTSHVTIVVKELEK